MTPEERAALASIGQQLAALATEPEPEPADVAETAAEVAAVVAADVAEVVADDVAASMGDAAELQDAITEAAVVEELAEAEHDVAVIDAQTEHDVAVIEAEAAAEVAVLEAAAEVVEELADDGAPSETVDDSSDGVLLPLDGDGALDSGAGGVVVPIAADTPPAPTHPWFRSWLRRS